MRRYALILLAAAGCNSGSEVGGGSDGSLPSPTPTPDGGRPIDAGPPMVDAKVVDPKVPPSVDGRITINEMMASNALSLRDPMGASPDWVELYNPTDMEIPLESYSLTTDFAVPRKAPIGAGVAIPARGRLVFYFDGRFDLGPQHLPLELAQEGGVLGFTRPDGSFIDRLTYGAQETDFSAARTPDGSAEWRIEWHVTPNQPNPSGAGMPAPMKIDTTPPEVVPPAGDLSERILGYNEVPRFELLVPPAAAMSLETNPRTYVQATLVYDGRSYGPIGLRLKGMDSFQPFSQKPSLRINVDEYVPKAKFFGLKDLTLNNMDNDPSMMHERLAYYVARSVGLPASRSNHALVTVNGQLYGLYANVETVKRVFLERWFMDASGPLYEATDVDFTANYIPRYELDSGTDDRTLLSGLANALTIADADQAIAAADPFVNIDEFQRFWAMCSMVGQFDSFPYSQPGDDYFVYADPLTHRLHFMPWGMDETWQSSSYPVTNIHSILAQKCTASPACFRAYVNHVWDILSITESMNLVAERDRVAAQIAPFVVMDTRKPYSNDMVTSWQGAIRYFLLHRRDQLSQMLPPP